MNLCFEKTLAALAGVGGQGKKNAHPGFVARVGGIFSGWIKTLYPAPG